MIKKEMLAMILAGGQGTRLKILTKNNAKPAVPFGGKYRIIDFTLSNCSNSGIDTIGVLTQYEPHILNSHIGIGSPWDLDRNRGGVSILPPHMRNDGGNWYMGTADAIYQNIMFIDKYDPEYLLVLSGDHIYKMDYSKMLKFHKEKNSDATIAVIDVPLEEASRFGIMNTEDDNKIYEFEEKPENPKSNKASMGIYIFNWKILKEFLIEDSELEDSDHDFGKNIIPNLLSSGYNLYAYSFNGYWKDVGTIESLWQANMDLLNPENKLDIYNRDWTIYSVSPTKPPQYTGPNAIIQNSLVVEGCAVFGKVQNSVLFPEVEIGKNSIIEDSVVMSNVKIGENAIIRKCIIGSHTIIEKNSVIGNSDDITVIGDGEKIKTNSIIKN
ncbi:glucose-1-phosphate adenylyltransferase [Clostridium botulinum]|uniref:Glucose-1-phosphate adenylyltransferase n=1 Tax=Clostridium botulinum C/D str. DC5 TaxID=1443128 RepID=A0A0A0IEF0_CLOBO|nr:glucose-1-phosphate adenylyltransferase [Clostridium botulinum]KEI06774.1 glucose-1-phosphate adenylyltransferase [Clostridium botulinum C/D str. BKT75002]KEI10884.1 glucose-1-phosphate adenylyltransferase [Clostridium botulinum C/D str. BKT2873]KGM93485.1 glucose-1-phosphate adenylyltransferase [Clostridium botulinum D str. CCUG 7971]KGM99337.1 glucose-1-phosphate adenylyltransferase [Clostridium botulinum C/D str. DC5]KOC49196.1 glucose-1-phosphate adenylyltransferase [Clostridium botulin